MAGADLEALFEQVFAGELRASEVAELRAVLERRIAGIRRIRQKGELYDTDLDDLERQLAVLREEELIAGFIERGLVASKRRDDILAELGERDDPAAE